MKTTASFSLHPRAMRAFRAAARANGATTQPAAEALLMQCLAVTPAPGSKPKKTAKP